MKRIENCEINEMIRPVFDGWWDDGGAGPMKLERDYYVHKLCPDPAGRGAPYSYVKIRAGDGVEYVLNYGRMVLSRLEPPPSLGELATMPHEFWVSSNGQYYDTGANKAAFQRLVAQAHADGIKVSIAKPMRPKSGERSYSLKMENIGLASSLSRQAATLVSLIIGSGKADGIAENELADLLRENGFKLNTKQDPWKIFVYYKKPLVEMGVLEVHG